MADRLHLQPRHRRLLEGLLREHLPDVEVWAYGSRVDGRSHDGSDLDLVLRGPGLEEIPLERLLDFEDGVRESTIPFLVDARDWARLPERFHREIEREYVVVGAAASSRGGNAARDRSQHWSTMPFTEAFLINPTVAIERGTLTPYVDMAAVEPGFRAVRARRARAFSGSGSKFRDGDTLFARITPCLENGKIARYDAATHLDVAYGSTEFIVVRGRQEITDANYAFYVSCSDLVREYAISQMTGTSGRQRVPVASLAHLEVAVPPLSEQRAIAHILGTLDDRIELNGQMNETLEAMARALFKSWFVDFDPVRAMMEGRDTGLPQDIANLFPDRLVDSEMGEIPEGWEQGTLNDLARLNPESWSSRNAPHRIRYLDLANTKWGSINDVQEFKWQDAPSRGRRVLRRGDTIVGTVRPRNGSFALVDRNGLTGSTAFAVLRPVTPTERELVWCAATSEEAIKRLAHLADGGAYPAVRPRAVLDTVVTLPGSRVRRAFSTLVAPLVNRLQENQRDIRTLAALRDTLLPKLISGAIRVPRTEWKR